MFLRFPALGLENALFQGLLLSEVGSLGPDRRIGLINKKARDVPHSSSWSKGRASDGRLAPQTPIPPTCNLEMNPRNACREPVLPNVTDMKAKWDTH